MSTTFTPKQVASYFITPIEDMPKISDYQTKPTYNSIDLFQRKLDKNLLPIPSIKGDLGFLGLAVIPTEYALISGGDTFITPPDTGKAPSDPTLFVPTSAAQKLAYPFIVQESIRIFIQRKIKFKKISPKFIKL